MAVTHPKVAHQEVLVAVAVQEVVLLQRLVLHQVVAETLLLYPPHKEIMVVQENLQVPLQLCLLVVEAVQVLLEELVLTMVVLVVQEQM